MPFYMDVLNFMFTSQTSGGLKVILMNHFILTALGGLGCSSPTAYVFYNSIIIVSLLWSIYDKKNWEPLRLVMAFELCAFFIDIFYFGVLIDECYSFKERFSAAMVFLQCATRPCVAFYLIKRKSVQETLTEDDEPDQYDFVESGSSFNQDNSNKNETAKEMTDMKEEKYLIENNPFENDYDEISSERMK